ncbi:MAG: glycosyltransferase family 4 protein [Nitrospirota bacterium]
MRILHLLYESKGDYFGIGGVAERAYKIYEYLKGRHDITLLCKKYPGAQNGMIEGLKHIFVGTESKSLIKTLLSYAYQSINFVRKHEEEFDIIIEEFSPAIPAFLHAFTKKPIILQVQGYTGTLYFKKYNPVYALMLYTMEHLRPRFYKKFIFISAATVKKLLPEDISLDRRDACPTGNVYPCISRSGVSPDLPSLKRKKNIEVIPNGVSPELLDTQPSEGDYILYIGRIDIYGKGLDILISAYKEFYKSFPDIGLVIAGDGRDREAFKAELMTLPVDVRKNIELLGWLSGDKKTEVISKALYAVFPSRHDVQSISTLEAIAYGKAVIVSDIPEFNYVIQNEAGMSFKTGNAPLLAQSMKELMMSNERKDMGQRGRDFVKDYTWDKVALKYEEFLQNVLADE